MRRAVPVVLALSLFAVRVAPAAEPASKVVEKTLPLAADGRLAIDTYKGRVSVIAWDRAEVSIRAVVKPDGECDRAAELVERTRVRIEGGGREVRVVSDYDDLPKIWFSFRDDCSSRPVVEYDIRVPHGATLDLSDYKSRISVEGLGGDVSVESYKGVARLTGLSGRLDVETYKGDVRAELARVAGDLRVETYKGEIEVVLPKGSRVALDEEIGRRGRLVAELEETGSGPRLVAETYKGTIRVREK